MKDLILGEHNGNVRIYLNTNSDAIPVFNGYFLLQQGGANFDCGSYSLPHIVDWNNDNKKDVICGNEEGRMWLLINNGTNATPVFDTKVYIEGAGGYPLDAGDRAAPTVVDWNRDGNKDILCGTSIGYIYYFQNEGTDANPSFTGYKTKLTAAGITIDFSSTCRPDAVDWDNDGVMDIICGDYYGYVAYFHSLGPMALSQNFIPENTGAAIDIALNAGPNNANRKYFILGSVSGIEPGLALPGGHVTLPLNWDVFTDIVISLWNTPLFANFAGMLNSDGKASAQLYAPPLVGYAGLRMHYAYALNKPYDYVSNAATVDIVP